MRIPHSQFYDYMKITEKIEFDIGGDILFFPIEVDGTEKEKTTEYGTVLMEQKEPANSLERYTGTLCAGIALMPAYAQSKDENGNIQTKIDKMIGSLAYCKTTDLLRFNIIEYMALIKQENISDEEKSKLAALECYIVDRKSAKISRLELS